MLESWSIPYILEKESERIDEECWGKKEDIAEKILRVKQNYRHKGTLEETVITCLDLIWSFKQTLLFSNLLQEPLWFCKKVAACLGWTRDEHKDLLTASPSS